MTQADYATDRRAKKAAAIVGLLKRFGFTRRVAERMNQDQWTTVAWAASVNPPSQTTIQLVLEALGPAPRRECRHQTRRAAPC
jgi:hypothetical protein